MRRLRATRSGLMAHKSGELNTEDTEGSQSTRRFLLTETGADETYDLGVMGYCETDRNEQWNDRGEPACSPILEDDLIFDI